MGFVLPPVGIPQFEGRPHVIGASTRTVDDATGHATQQEVDWPLQYRHAVDRGAPLRGNRRQPAGFTEPTRVHGSGERLEVRLPRQRVIQAVESFSGTEKLARGLTGARRTWL